MLIYLKERYDFYHGDSKHLVQKSKQNERAKTNKELMFSPIIPIYAKYICSKNREQFSWPHVRF